MRVGGRRGGTSAARPSAVKALLQRSSLHELLAVLKASHQFVVRASMYLFWLVHYSGGVCSLPRNRSAYIAARPQSARAL